MAKLKRALARAKRRADGGGVDDPTAGMSPVDLMKLRAELPDRRTDAERATARQGNRAELFDLVLGGRTAAEMGRDIAAAPTLPAAAAQTGIAGLEAGLGLLGMRGPGKGAGNRLNVFVGPESKTADREALAVAEQMREAGAPRGAIWSQTGWGWDEMGNPFYEIDDSASKLRTRGAGEAAPKKFSEFYDHPELFAARPDIGEMKFAHGNVGTGAGDFEAPRYGFEGKIRVGKGTDQRGIALHEAQHAADQRRGSSWGANVDEPNVDDLRVATSRIMNDPEIGPLFQRKIVLEKHVSEVEAVYGPYSEETRLAKTSLWDVKADLSFLAAKKKIDLNPAQFAYHRNAGEVRARNTADERADMTALQRRQQNPWSTQDTPDQDQLFGKMQPRLSRSQSVPPEKPGNVVGLPQGRVSNWNDVPSQTLESNLIRLGVNPRDAETIVSQWHYYSGDIDRVADELTPGGYMGGYATPAQLRAAVRQMDEPQSGTVTPFRPRRADGGRVARALRRAAVTVGAVRGATPGRSDELEVDVPAGSYVIPADVVSALGEGNTEAGMVRLERQMGGSLKNKGKSRPDQLKRANGGSVPILISDGEFVVSPEAVDAAGGNDALDRFVLAVRDAYTRHLQQIPGPNV